MKGGIFDVFVLNLVVGFGNVEIVKYLIESGVELDVSLVKRNLLFGVIYGGY